MLGEGGKREETEETVLPREKAMKYKPRLKSLCFLVTSGPFGVQQGDQLFFLRPLAESELREGTRIRSTPGGKQEGRKSFSVLTWIKDPERPGAAWGVHRETMRLSSAFGHHCASS